MKILIIRHGDPDYANGTVTEKGAVEAEALSNRLKKLDIKQFYCSPLGRAQDTAKPTLEKMGRTAITFDWLREFNGYVFDEKSDKLSDKYLILDNHMVIGNFGGYPSITIPSGFVDNMPVGINITGRIMEDDVVLNIANKIESSMEYANQIAKEMK